MRLYRDLQHILRRYSRRADAEMVESGLDNIRGQELHRDVCTRDRELKWIYKGRKSQIEILRSLSLALPRICSASTSITSTPRRHNGAIV